MPKDTVTIKEVDGTAPLSPMDQFLQAQVRTLISRAASDHLMHHSVKRKAELLTEVAVELDSLLEDEEIMAVMGLDRHERLMGLLWRVRKES